jgi:hypothetical protein
LFARQAMDVGLFFLSRLACRFSMSVLCGFFFADFLESCDLDMWAISRQWNADTGNVPC